MTTMQQKWILPASLAFACLGLSATAPLAARDSQDRQEHNNVRPAIKWKRFDYTCENNAKVTVYLHETSAKVYFQDHLYLMRQTPFVDTQGKPSADGTRYSDGKVIWWSKGDDGFLQEDTPDGDGQKIVKDCYLVQSPGPQASSLTVTGTITYLVRMALPPQAIIEVQLLDVSRSDGPSILVAEKKFTLGERGVPLPFTLSVEASKIDPKHAYAASARILVVGELRFATREPYKVLTQGNPSKADLVLLPVGAKP